MEAALSGEEGVLAVWPALAKAWPEERAAFSAWAAAPRPALDPARLAELAAVRREAMDLLPRLNPAPLARLEGEEREAALKVLYGWLADGEDAPTAHHAALLLAEMGHITPQTAPLLCACLEDPDDLTRYRARRALNRERAASAAGKGTIEQMARCYRCRRDEAARAGCAVAGRGDCRHGAAGVAGDPSAYAADTYLGWSLQEIRHDRPEWLEEWAASGERGVLSRIHRLDGEAWPAFLSLLERAAPPVQEALLDSASWLLRLDRVPEAQQEELVARILALLESASPIVRAAAVVALGHLRRSTERVIHRLLALSPEHTSRAPHHQALARLAARADDEPRARITQALVAAGAHAALVRLGVSRGDEALDLATLRAAPGLGKLDAPALLQALLQAGTDDDLWGNYHERISSLVRELVEGNGELLQDLLRSLEEALEGSEWPPRRICLAAVAACAAAMPDALNDALRRLGGGRELLVKGTRDAGSFNSRRFGVTALSHLREATPEAIAVLLQASQDVPAVQRDAIAAAGRFRHLSAGFSHQEALAPLAEALSGPSGAAAYVAAQLLAALGSSPAALGVPGLRGRIAALISDALRHPDAGREVYLFEPPSWWSGEAKIESRGPLSKTFFAALIRVWGLPE